MSEELTEFERYSQTRDYIANWDDPFGPDFIYELHSFEIGFLVDPKNLKYQTVIKDPRWI